MIHLHMLKWQKLSIHLVMVTPQNKAWLLEEVRRDMSPVDEAPLEDAPPAVTWPVHLVNQPNPFNPTTHIAFDLPQAVDARLVVYDTAGRRVAILHDGPLAAGAHRIPWRGRDAAGRSVASGVYVYRLTTGDRSATGRMVLAR